MEIQESKVSKLILTGLDKLDYVCVILQDFDDGQGNIIITCFGEAWTAYWGAMGKRTIREFILSADEYYLAKSLSNISSTVIDYDLIGKAIDECVDRETLILHSDKMIDAYGQDWIMDLPTKPNPEYEYLLRIIKAVQQGIRTTHDY